MCVGNFHWKKGSCTKLLTYFWKNFTPGIKWSRFFCWRTNFFFLSRAAVGAVFLGVCGFRHYQLVVLQDFTWPVPRHQCTKWVRLPLPKFQRQNLFNQNRSTIYWLIFKTDSILHVVISQSQIYCFCKGHKIRCLKWV